MNTELRRHPDPIRYTLLAAFCWLRLQEVIDNVVELLLGRQSQKG